MKKKIMALCDPEEAYLRRMAEYLEGKDRLPFRVCAFTDVLRLKELCEKEDVSLILISEELYRKEMKESFAAQIMLLKESGREVDAELVEIGKYQSSEIIYREIMNGRAGQEEASETLFSAGRMKLIGNYSPVRRCLQTTFSLCMGQLLAEGHRVLYLNFESYSGFSYLLNRDFTADLSDILYFFRCEKEQLAGRLKEMVQSVNGLDYVPPALSYEDLNAVTGKQWLRLFREIEKAAGYEYLILDLSEQIQGLFDILKECHKVYTVTGKDSFAAAKMKQYELLLKMNEYEAVKARSRKCELPVFRQLPGGLEQLTHGDLAAYVKKIIEEDMNGITGEYQETAEGTDIRRH